MSCSRVWGQLPLAPKRLAACSRVWPKPFGGIFGFSFSKQLPTYPQGRNATKKTLKVEKKHEILMEVDYRCLAWQLAGAGRDQFDG
ncbi:hypothetical protein WN944_026387 [Citrus x changshan-huyou]|uniref:Uncharacterized protein n=1 Tax=Citrus x changshan-huyou TaxID=2935761 RepID=A0AAP0LSY0_9ROSI